MDAVLSLKMGDGKSGAGRSGARGQLAAGARVAVRGEEWVVRRLDRTSSGSLAVSCVGVSELVQDREAIFLDEIDPIRVLDPVDTRLVPDPSPSYEHALLYLESLLRQSPPTDARIHTGHRAAMDLIPFQLDPAIQALREPRQRILIADAVGLGKTIECGILLSELIRRGRGKRILVLAVKSMLTQFQKELWARFTIPLTRLDSQGIRRTRREIPSNENPFHRHDKAIISIDTLKQESEYRTYLENATWDIIVIDEAHNVAERGTNSMRSRLAKLVSNRSDTLIMLSATPHDGKKRSFASIMNMLNPTAIANPEDYGPEDIRGLFIRRFKKDIRAQVSSSFPEREIRRVYSEATPEEERVHACLHDLRTAMDERPRAGRMLFKTTLEKALFSSPAACHETLLNRLNTLRKANDPDHEAEIQGLLRLERELKALPSRETSKYRHLIKTLRDEGWTGKDPEDRLVIFTERIETLRFLAEQLPKDLGLSKDAFTTLMGSDPDVKQQEVVERFGREKDTLRLLIATDVAAEGINLHYLCHRLVHYDIPWSLLTFQQRNGRIDRYGQTRQPLITYLVTRSRTPGIQGDLRILELLIEKDEQVTRNIGDPSEFTGVYDSQDEELLTARAMEEGLQDVPYPERGSDDIDPLALLFDDEEYATPTGADALSQCVDAPGLFADDFTFATRALRLLQKEEGLDLEVLPDKKRVSLTVPKDLEFRLGYLPPEIELHNGQLHLTADRAAIHREMSRCRREENLWPQLHLLWELHPVLEWLEDKMTARFRRHEAPVLTLHGALKPREIIYVVSGVIPNRKGHPLIHRWLGLRFLRGTYDETLDFEELLRISELDRRAFANPVSEVDTAALQSHLPEVVQRARAALSKARDTHRQAIQPELDAQLARLRTLEGRQLQQLELLFGEREQKREQERRRVGKLFHDYTGWIRDTLLTEDQPYIRIAAVLTGGGE